MSAVRFSQGSVTQPCELLACGSENRSSLSGGLTGASKSGAAYRDGNIVDMQNIAPARGRQGVEEIPFGGLDPIPQVAIPPFPGGWGAFAEKEDSLRRFENRNTQGLDGGGRSTVVTRFTPQLVQYQQPDDLSRQMSFERNMPSQVKKNHVVYV